MDHIFNMNPNLKGIIFAILSAFFITLSSALITYTKNVDALTKTFFVLALVSPISIPILITEGVNPFRGKIYFSTLLF